MRNFSIAIALTIAIAALNTAQSQSVNANSPNGGFQLMVPQPQYPFIIFQPDDQCVPFGSNATFSVTALNANGYQWLFNGNAVANGTNSTLVIQNAGIQNVGYYSCDVFNGPESVPTRSASLQVYTNWIDPKTGVDPMVVYSFPYPGGGGSGSCPGHYVGYVNFTKPYTNGWGWSPDTTNGNTVFTATDNNQTNTKVQYYGAYGDIGCNQTTVTVPNPPYSPVYRFTIYFTNNVPTNAYPITLSGFNP
ncbi:MAG TPA: immunoglobulin domain-containing protein [Verrucomicrobiae bacterium]|nr:immunoglobulin domain-containing protein [Verrucomicrobiae bacterium]